MSKETEELLNKLESMEDAPLIWINQKVLNLYKENQQLKERITYLENSNNRREETIISLRNEQQLDLYKEVIEEVRDWISPIIKIEKARPFYEGIKRADINELLQILDKVKHE